MNARRLLLIDSDPEFQQLLEHRLGPHGFAVLTPPDPSNPLAQVKELNPAVIFIAVELPDKIGYALCNKAKKGPASHVPVVLITSTVPASGFKSHRKLKVHADEYIDKRTMTPDEVLRVVDQLVGLGNYVASSDDMDVEELDVDDLDMDEAADDVASEFDQDDQATPEPVDEPLALPSAGHASSGFEENAFGVDVDDLADEIDRAMDEVSGIRELPHVLFASSSGLAMPAGLPASDDVVSSASLHGRGPDPMADPGEFEAEADQTAVASPPHEPEPELEQEPEPQPEPEPEPARLAPPPVLQAHAAAMVDEAEHTTGDDLPEPPAPEAVPRPIQQAGSQGAELDLGLEEVASQAEEEKSGVHDRRYQVKVLQLEEEIARLKAALDDARRQPAGGGSFSREREFLNLREVINKKEKEILELRESLAARDGEILKFRQTIRELRQERTAFDERNVELEREMLDLREKTEELEAERGRLAEQKQTTDKVLAAARAELIRVNDELGSERASRREEIESLARQRARALEDLKQELGEDRERSEAALAEKHGRDLRTLKEAYEETARAKDEATARQLEDERAAADSRREQALAELRRDQVEVLERLEREQAAERAAAVAAVQSQRDSELAEAERRREKDLAEAERRRVSELADAEKRRADDLAAADEKRAAAENALVERFEGERAALEQEHREELAKQDKRVAERDAAVATLELTVRGLESDLAETRESERGRIETIDSLHRMLADRDQRLSTLRAELEELERVNGGYQEQILRAQQKIRSDETTVSRAKKALAVALTLLDEPEGKPRPEAGGNGR